MATTVNFCILLLSTLLLVTSFPECRADSAGHIMPEKGLAFGGIPYGSVSGMVAEYFRNGGAVYQYKPNAMDNFDENQLYGQQQD